MARAANHDSATCRAMIHRTACLLLFLVAASPAQAQAQAERESFARSVAPFFGQHCAACHGGDAPDAGLALDQAAWPDGTPSLDLLAVLRRVRRKLESGEMPPPEWGAPPPRSEVEAVLEFIRNATRAAARRAAAAPGRVTVRRLSRAEYRNTVRDLLGVEVDVSAFPADDLAYGFDNIGDALSVSTIHLEKHLAAASRIAAEAISLEDPAHPPVRRLQAEDIECSLENAGGGEDVTLYTNGEVFASVSLPRRGTYRFRARAFARQAGPDLARLELCVNGRRELAAEVRATRAAPETFELTLELPGGSQRFSAAFVNDYYEPDHADPAQRDRNLHVDWIEIVGPVDARELPPAHRWIFGADPGSGPPARRAVPIIERVASRAWRRPVTRSESERLGSIVASSVSAGDSFELAIRTMLEAVLVSPSFLFRLEPGAHRGTPGAAQGVDSWALASRLSYYLWSSLPDEALLERARSGELAKPEVLLAEARRLLADPRSEALAQNFAAQWLELRALDEVQPDPARYPAFTPSLRASMRKEAELFFDAVLRERRGVFTLIDADFTYADAELARLYGLAGVPEGGFRRVPLRDGRRGGLVTQAAMLTVTSNPNRTSPVKRGKWVLQNLLDAAPPPPPPGNDSLAAEDAISGARTLRERLEQHRQRAECASCHSRMDALGFSLETFDGIGRWREEDEDGPIDTAATLPGGARIDGVADLKRVLRGPPFVRCLAGKLFVYAVGRPPAIEDELVLDAMVDAMPKEPALEDLVLSIVGLDAFRKREVTR